MHDRLLNTIISAVDLMNATTNKIRSIMEQKPYIDWRTLSVILIMVIGFPVLGWLHYHQIIGTWLAFLYRLARTLAS